MLAYGDVGWTWSFLSPDVAMAGCCSADWFYFYLTTGPRLASVPGTKQRRAIIEVRSNTQQEGGEIHLRMLPSGFIHSTNNSELLSFAPF